MYAFHNSFVFYVVRYASKESKQFFSERFLYDIRLFLYICLYIPQILLDYEAYEITLLSVCPP
jgi:hypothetical protein